MGKRFADDSVNRFFNIENMENSIANFEIRDTFIVTNVGLVLSGLILEGEISPGCFIKFEKNGLNIESEIINVEFITHSNQLPLIGLIVKFENNDEIEELKAWNPNFQIANILKI